jgi:hypothetical protein
MPTPNSRNPRIVYLRGCPDRRGTWAAVPRSGNGTPLPFQTWFRRASDRGRCGRPGGRSRGRRGGRVSALALHLVQAAIVYLNTHMIQIVLRDPKWRAKLTDADRRGLSALFWSHLNLYGRFELDMANFLDLGIDADGGGGPVVNDRP